MKARVGASTSPFVSMTSASYSTNGAAAPPPEGVGVPPAPPWPAPPWPLLLPPTPLTPLLTLSPPLVTLLPPPPPLVEECAGSPEQAKLASEHVATTAIAPEIEDENERDFMGPRWPKGRCERFANPELPPVELLK